MNNPNRFWNRRRVAAGNQDAGVNVARKLWGDDENSNASRTSINGGNNDTDDDGLQRREEAVGSKTEKKVWKPYYLENFLVSALSLLFFQRNRVSKLRRLCLVRTSLESHLFNSHLLS